MIELGREAEFKHALATKGWFLFEAAVEEPFVEQLCDALSPLYDIRRAIQIRNGVDALTAGTAHHIVERTGPFMELLGRGYLDTHLREYFGGAYILNAFGGTFTSKSFESYALNFHRDVRTYVTEIHLLINVLYMLDDFTADNGATRLLSGSHLTNDKPDLALADERSERAIGKRGSILVWDSNLWHSAGKNKTEFPRRALTITFSPPYIKQQFDYPRHLGYDLAETLSPVQRQVLGYNARVPATFDEFYQPPEKRFYRRDQG